MYASGLPPLQRPPPPPHNQGYPAACSTRYSTPSVGTGGGLGHTIACLVNATRCDGSSATSTVAVTITARGMQGVPTGRPSSATEAVPTASLSWSGRAHGRCEVAPLRSHLAGAAAGRRRRMTRGWSRGCFSSGGTGLPIQPGWEVGHSLVVWNGGPKAPGCCYFREDCP